MKTVKTSFVTVQFKQWEVTIDLIRSIELAGIEDYEVIVVDNNSPGYNGKREISSYKNVLFIEASENHGFAKGNNVGFAAAKGTYIFMVNNDIEITATTLPFLMDTLESDHKVGAVSPKILYWEDKALIQYAGSTPVNPATIRNQHIGNKKPDHEFIGTIETPYGHGAAMLFRRSLLKVVGGIPEEYFLYYEEVDWCTRITKAGFTIKCCREAKVYHKESISTGKDSPLKTFYLNRNRVIYAKMHLKGIALLLAFTYLYLLAFPRNSFKYLLKPAHLKASVLAFISAAFPSFFNLQNPYQA